MLSFKLLVVLMLPTGIWAKEQPQLICSTLMSPGSQIMSEEQIGGLALALEQAWHPSQIKVTAYTHQLESGKIVALIKVESTRNSLKLTEMQNIARQFVHSVGSSWDDNQFHHTTTPHKRIIPTAYLTDVRVEAPPIAVTALLASISSLPDWIQVTGGVAATLSFLATTVSAGFEALLEYRIQSSDRQEGKSNALTQALAESLEWLNNHSESTGTPIVIFMDGLNGRDRRQSSEERQERLISEHGFRPLRSP